MLVSICTHSPFPCHATSCLTTSFPLLCLSHQIWVAHHPLSGPHWTHCYFPFHFYSLLWCSHKPPVHLRYLSPLPASLQNLFSWFLMLERNLQQTCFCIPIQKPVSSLCSVLKAWITAQVAGELLLLPCRYTFPHWVLAVQLPCPWEATDFILLQKA